jgi:hypothetical protein
MASRVVWFYYSESIAPHSPTRVRKLYITAAVVMAVGAFQLPSTCSTGDE